MLTVLILKFFPSAKHGSVRLALKSSSDCDFDLLLMFSPICSLPGIGTKGSDEVLTADNFLGEFFCTSRVGWRVSKPSLDLSGLSVFFWLT
ncbi:hypothetical protein DPMN_054384 [Dreissena polymorpha]|uniref:Uncharacterized protein n=1 Tax=Dreissena polymorpha TaxID=45954 RepID=A0A9D4HT15_DREPO|nr:hypothetical protein DPMN_054384 [Dreissena polymorpha]